MKLTNKKLHIALILVGIVFIFLSAFHENIWFDESYSVAIARHNFGEIWNITGNDVHPPLYYWGLHIVGMITNYSILSYRLFSVLAIVILGIIGYTHIRKDFGEKTGLIFSFLTYFMPIMCTYSQEIRMYSWSCLIVTLLGIYAYRFYKSVKEDQDKQLKNLILFGIFSISSCYIHYYALVATGVINLILLIWLIKNAKKLEAGKKNLKNFIILALVQIVAYIPWLIYLKEQLVHVGGGFWITLDPIITPVEVLSFQFRRNLGTSLPLKASAIISLLVAILMYIYIAYCSRKAKKENQDTKPGALAIKIYIAVILLMLLASIISPILFSRYLFVLTGLYIFALAFFMAKEKRTWVTVLICAIILVLGIYSNVMNTKVNYDDSNMKQIEYLKENVKPDDILIFSNMDGGFGVGGVVSAFFPENKQYFYDAYYWNVEEAYKAYAPGMQTVYNYEDNIKDYHGRIWLIMTDGTSLYDNFNKDEVTIFNEPVHFDTAYSDYVYNIVLLEK